LRWDNIIFHFLQKDSKKANLIAYNKILLKNLAIQRKSKFWYAHQLISADLHSEIHTKYPANYYKPNIFIKAGLFLFSLFVALSALGFITLAFMPFFTYSSNYTTVSLIISLLMMFASLISGELLIRKKNLFKTGIVEALLYTAAGSFVAFVIILFDSSNNYENFTLMICAMCLPFFLIAALRYLDLVLMAAAIYCFYAVCFFLLIKAGEIAKMIMPFALMLIAGISYILSSKMRKNEKYFLYERCIRLFEFSALLVFYCAGNYYVIRESSVEFFHLVIEPGEDIPMAWFFYLFTAVVPMIYLWLGLKNKDKLRVWSSLLFIGISALTFKYYFSLGHPALALTLAGLFTVFISWLSIRLLKNDRAGLTFKEDINEDHFLKTNAEALAIAQGFISQQGTQSTNETSFGGGEFGGGGSGSKF